MTSRYETEANLSGEPAPYQKLPASAEPAYEHLTSYGFARRYVKGKIVAHMVGREGAGYSSRLLAQSAASVTALNDLSKASSADSASFDVVVALGMLEDLDDPEELVREARRLLKEDGMFIVSARDKQANERGRAGIDGRREMYVPEFRGMLERHFGHVRLYRQGTVAGGFVFPDAGEEPGAAAGVEVARFSVAEPRPGAGVPLSRTVMAVCGDGAEFAEAVGEEGSYLLLDQDGRVFDESEDRLEDVELLRDEIARIQETEVQAFVDAIKVRQTLIQELPRYLPHMRSILLAHLIHRRAIIYGNIYAIKRKGAKGLAIGAFRRSATLYRRLQARTRGSD
jgi:SAM-dependent methyltransferase